MALQSRQPKKAQDRRRRRWAPFVPLALGFLFIAYLKLTNLGPHAFVSDHPGDRLFQEYDVSDLVGDPPRRFRSEQSVITYLEGCLRGASAAGHKLQVSLSAVEGQHIVFCTATPRGHAYLADAIARLRSEESRARSK